MSTGAADGGGTGEVGTESTVIENEVADTTPSTDPAEVVEGNEGTEDTGNEEIDFDNLFDEAGNQETTIDQSLYDGLKELGIDTGSPTFKAQIGELNELGITDPKVQANLLKKARENEQRELNKTPQEIKEQLNRELLPEAKNNYKAINNVVKEIWGSDPETYKAIMSDSVAINMMAKVHAFYKGQAPADVTPANTKPVASGFDTSQAEAEYQKLMADAYSKGKGYEMRDKVIEQVLSKTSPQHKKQVESILGYNNR